MFPSGGGLPGPPSAVPLSLGSSSYSNFKSILPTPLRTIFPFKCVPSVPDAFGNSLRDFSVSAIAKTALPPLISNLALASSPSPSLNLSVLSPPSNTV